MNMTLGDKIKYYEINQILQEELGNKSGLSGTLFTTMKRVNVNPDFIALDRIAEASWLYFNGISRFR